MIREVILTTLNAKGEPHIAPFGIRMDGDEIVIAPFRPSRTLDNLSDTMAAVINYTDDVRVFAGCLTHRRQWMTKPASVVEGVVLKQALAHTEVRVKKVEEDPERPQFFCEAVYDEMDAPFLGLNRAKGAVIEASILISRLERLPLEKIEHDIAYLSTAIEKTAGKDEQQAWDWLMDYFEEFKTNLKRSDKG